jgi:hypothetical protein
MEPRGRKSDFDPTRTLASMRPMRGGGPAICGYAPHFGQWTALTVISRQGRERLKTRSYAAIATILAFDLDSGELQRELGS